MELAHRLLGQICMCLPMRGGGSRRDRVVPGIGQQQYVVPRESWQGTRNWLSSHRGDEGQGTGTCQGPWPGEMCWKAGSCTASARNLRIKITSIFQVGNTSQILPCGGWCGQMPNCLQLPLAQIHRTTGTVLASSSLDIRGAWGVCLGAAPTQAALHSLDIPLQEEGWGVMRLLIPLLALGTWAGSSQHSTALRTRSGCRVQSCKGPSPPRSQPAEAGGLRWLPRHHTALALAMP